MNERVSDERLAALIEYGAPGGLAPHDFMRIVRELQEMRAQESNVVRLADQDELAKARERNDENGNDRRRDMPDVVGSADLGVVFSQSAYTMSEPHLSGYRLVVGFKTLPDVQAAHEAIANLSKRPTHVEVWKS